MSDAAAREIREALTDPRGLCERLNLIAGPRSFTRQASGVIIRCPFHDEHTPSCSVRLGRDRTVAVRCHGCGATGDALSLIAIANGLTMRGDDFRQVLILGAELARLYDLQAQLESGKPAGEVTRAAPKPRPKLPPEPERDYPPADEVADLWARTLVLDADAQTWARGRGLDPDLLGQTVGGHALARSLPLKGDLPWWARYQGKTWRETGHRLVVPMFDATGTMRSVRAIRIVDGDSPKRLPPGGYRASALVMACDLALGMLRGTFAPRRVLVVEGEPDTLAWMTERTKLAYARFGIVSGSWTREFASRIPHDCDVIAVTHGDDAGERYAKEIEATLTSQRFFRWRPQEAA